LSPSYGTVQTLLTSQTDKNKYSLSQAVCNI
jgi:hypothetical protein